MISLDTNIAKHLVNEYKSILDEFFKDPKATDLLNKGEFHSLLDFYKVRNGYNRGEELLCLFYLSGINYLEDFNYVSSGYNIPMESLDAFTIPNNIHKIDAIVNSEQLTYLSIPTSVKEIVNLGQRCDLLTEVYYDGTVDDWDNIRLVYPKHSLSYNIKQIHCANGTIMVN